MKRLHGDADKTKLHVGASGERDKADGFGLSVKVGVFGGRGIAPSHQRVSI